MCETRPRMPYSTSHTSYFSVRISAALILTGCPPVTPTGTTNFVSDATNDSIPDSTGSTTPTSAVTSSTEDTGTSQATDTGTSPATMDTETSGVPEVCDHDGICDGREVSEPACHDDCPICGDGFVDQSEACDDRGESSSCNADCTPATCGDSYANALSGEDCDDGNQDDTDECVSCKLAVCGDGFTWLGQEPCDDGNKDNADECSEDCELPRLVFVSSTKYDGDVVGLAGAHLVCETLAGQQWQGRRFRAWLSDEETSPSLCFDTSFKGAYKLVDGTVVALGWDDLTDGALIHAIDRAQDGTLITGRAWTNTLPDGTPATGPHCDAWTSAFQQDSGRVGDIPEIDMKWTNNGDTASCLQDVMEADQGMHIYCFEDPEQCLCPEDPENCVVPMLTEVKPRRDGSPG
jgi:cysteine-rich repeat protein